MPNTDQTPQTLSPSDQSAAANELHRQQLLKKQQQEKEKKQKPNALQKKAGQMLSVTPYAGAVLRVVGIIKKFLTFFIGEGLVDQAMAILVGIGAVFVPLNLVFGWIPIIGSIIAGVIATAVGPILSPIIYPKLKPILDEATKLNLLPTSTKK